MVLSRNAVSPRLAQDHRPQLTTKSRGPKRQVHATVDGVMGHWSGHRAENLTGIPLTVAIVGAAAQSDAEFL
jgi:hypothetical protein